MSVPCRSSNRRERRGRLSIGDVAERAGVSPGLLRMWEQRFGFPQPTRLPSGHRRYSDADVEAVREVLARQESGLRLDRAVAAVRALRRSDEPSVFAAVRGADPRLPRQRLRKSTLVALSHAIEDEMCARGRQGFAFGAFQTGRYFAQAEARWRDIARRSRCTMAIADFPDGLPAASGQGRTRCSSPSREAIRCVRSGPWSATRRPSRPCSAPGSRLVSPATPTTNASSRRSGRWTPGPCAPPPSSASISPRPRASTAYPTCAPPSPRRRRRPRRRPRRSRTSATASSPVTAGQDESSMSAPTAADRARQVTVTVAEIVCVVGTLVGVGVSAPASQSRRAARSRPTPRCSRRRGRRSRSGR